MPDYKKMYSKLAVAMADSIEVMQAAMLEAEEIYSSGEERQPDPALTVYMCKMKNSEDVPR